MEFNRLISLVIGFIVLILVFVWIGSRFRSATTSQNDVVVTATVSPTPTGTDTTKRNWNPFAFLFNRNSPTPTLTVTKTPEQAVTIIPTQTPQGVTSVPNTTVVYKNNSTGTTTPISNSGVTQIPQTGASTLVIPLAFSALTLGAYLRKRA